MILYYLPGHRESECAREFAERHPDMEPCPVDAHLMGALWRDRELGYFPALVRDKPGILVGLDTILAIYGDDV